jgi:hypothetical protein
VLRHSDALSTLAGAFDISSKKYSEPSKKFSDASEMFLEASEKHSHRFVRHIFLLH